MFALAAQDKFIFASAHSYYESYGLDQTFLKRYVRILIKKKKPRQQSLFSSGHTSAVPSELGRSENPRYGLLVEMWYPPPQIEEGHSDLDCRIVSKKDFQTSFIGQEHLVV